MLNEEDKAKGVDDQYKKHEKGYYISIHIWIELFIAFIFVLMSFFVNKHIIGEV